ncbi:MAG: lipopolysaccharide biosynthesis protein [Cyanobacteria bacterium J06581_3]
MSLRKKTIKGIIWSSAESWGTQATQLLTFLVLARLLNPETFGLVSMSNVFIHFVLSVLNFGFSEAIIQRQDLESKHLNTAFWTNVGLGCFLTILGVSLAGTVADFFSEPQLVPIIQWLSLNILIRSFVAIQEAIQRRELLFKNLAVRQLIGVLAGCIAGLIMAVSGFGVWSLVVQTLLTSTVAMILLWKISSWRPQIEFSIQHFKELFSFGSSVIGINILMFFNLRSDDLLIGYFLGPVSLGYYTVAYKLLVTLNQLIAEAVRKVAMPAFSKLQSEPKKMQEAFYKASRLMSFLSLPLYFSAAILAPEIVLALFGTEWLPSVPVMQVLAFVGIFRAVADLVGPVIMAVGKPLWNLYLLIAASITKVVAFLIFVHWGIVSTAVGLLVAVVLIMPVRLSTLFTLIGAQWKSYVAQFILPFLSSFAMSATALLTKALVGHFLGGDLIFSEETQAYITIGLCLGLGGVAYVGTIRLLDPAIFKRALKFSGRS